MFYTLNEYFEPVKSLEYENISLIYSSISEDCYLSTVFLSLDHSFNRCSDPVLFESLWFGGIHDGRQQRYCTIYDAILGHRSMLIDYLEEIQS